MELSVPKKSKPWSEDDKCTVGCQFQFMFTRAIDRISLFCAKTSFFLMLSAMPLVAIWAYSYTAPTVRVELYNSLHHREETKQFFLSHFDGAYLQEPDAGRNKDYVVLPCGRTDEAVCIFMCVIAATVLFQVILFTFTQRRWMPAVVFVLLMVLLPFTGFSRHSPSPYEVTVAWFAQHTFQSLLGLFVFTVAAQFYCRRFINTEITS